MWFLLPMRPRTWKPRPHNSLLAVWYLLLSPLLNILQPQHECTMKITHIWADLHYSTLSTLDVVMWHIFLLRPHMLNNKYINIILGVDLVSREKASQRKIEHLECIFHWMPSATTAMARNDHTSLKVQSLESQIS